jgi:2'-5' RNA ligase
VRLFVAVELPPPCVAVAGDVSDALRERVTRLAPNAQVTWVPPERMHLTLRFLGEVTADHAALIATGLSAPFDAKAFPVTLGGPGAFPSRGAPRVLWLGFSEGLTNLGMLERELSSRLAETGIPPEDRPYRPHLTLARVRDPRGLRLAPLFEGVDVPAASGVIDAVTLFESRLSPKGSRYTALHRTPLERA